MLKEFITNNMFFGCLIIFIIVTYSVSLILATTVELTKERTLQLLKVSIAVALFLALIAMILAR